MNSNIRQEILMQLDKIIFEVRKVAMSSNPSDYIAANYEVEKQLTALSNKLQKELFHGE